MPTNETRRELLNRAKAAGYPGSITEVFQAADQGIDLIEQHGLQQQEQQMQVAQTPQEQEVGLREEHAAGNTDASMAFPDVQPNQSFNTVGMQAPIDIQKIDDQGHLVESYKNVPPGIQDLPTGPSEGTIIESPAAYQQGGFAEDSSAEQKAKDRGMKLVSSRRGYDDTHGDYTYYNYKNASRGSASSFRVYDKNPKLMVGVPSTIEAVQPGEEWFEGKIRKIKKKRKKEKILKISRIDTQQLPVNMDEPVLEKSLPYKSRKPLKDRVKDVSFSYDNYGGADDADVMDKHGRYFTLTLEDGSTMRLAPQTYRNYFGTESIMTPGKELRVFNHPKRKKQTGGERRNDLKIAISNVSTNAREKKLLESTNFAENSMGYNPAAYGREYTNSQASIDPIMLNDLFDERVDEDGKKQGYSKTQKKYFKRFKNLGLPTDKKGFKEELNKDNSVAAVEAMRMVYGRSPEAIPEITDTLGMFHYYNDNYRKNNKIKDLTQSKARFYEGYKTNFQFGGLKEKVLSLKNTYDKVSSPMLVNRKNLKMQANIKPENQSIAFNTTYNPTKNSILKGGVTYALGQGPQYNASLNLKFKKGGYTKTYKKRFK
tara:strand:+ start:508 stop:2301 length:1794 start_codon:yes stop_codon:yes gene_type:complete